MPHSEAFHEPLFHEPLNPSLPRNGLGPHPLYQEQAESALLDSVIGAGTSSGLLPEAATANLREELVDESALQVTNISPK